MASGEKHGEVKAPRPVAIEGKARLPKDESVDMMQGGERAPPQSFFEAEGKTSCDGEDRGAHGNGGSSWPAEPLSPKPRVGGMAGSNTCDTAGSPPSPKDIPAQKGDTDTHGKAFAEGGTTAGGLHAGKRPYVAKAFEVAPPLPLSPGPVRGNDFLSAARLDVKGCPRHGLAPCSLCSALSSSSPRSSGGRSMTPLLPARVLGGPCDRHLLLDCILCKILSPAVCGDGLSPTSYRRPTPHQHVLGRSTSLPLLGGTFTGRGDGRGNGGGDGGGGIDISGVPVTASTETALYSPSSSRCERHDLLCCFLCGSTVKSPTAPRVGDSTNTRHGDDRPVLSPAPRLVLPSPTSHGGAQQAGGASPASAFIDQPLRSSRDAALGSGSATSEIDPIVVGGEWGNSGRWNKDSPEHAVGRSILFKAPRPSGATTEVATDAEGPTVSKVCEGSLGPDDAEDAGSRRVDAPSSSKPQKPSRGGFQGRHVNRETTENLFLAGGGIFRARESSDRISHAADNGKSTGRVRDRKAPGGRSADAVDAVRHRLQHRSRGGTPRRRTPKPSTGKLTGQGRRNRGHQGSKASANGDGVVRGRAQANTVVSATRAREKLGDDDLAARAITAALAVLQ